MAWLLDDDVAEGGRLGSGLRGMAPLDLSATCLGLLSRLSSELVLAMLLLSDRARLCSSRSGPRLEERWVRFRIRCWML